MQFIKLLSWVFLLTNLAACTGMYTKSPAPVSVGDIVQMSEMGVSAASIINKIQASGTVYRLTASQLANLKKQGVSDGVINYMQATYLESVRQNQQLNDNNYWMSHPDGFMYGGYPYGWDNGWYPDTPYSPAYDYAPSEAPFPDNNSDERSSADGPANDNSSE